MVTDSTRICTLENIENEESDRCTSPMKSSTSLLRWSTHRHITLWLAVAASRDGWVILVYDYCEEAISLNCQQVCLQL